MDEKKVILFDYDGTILDTFGEYAKEYVKIAHLFGIKKNTKEDFKNLYENNLSESLAELGVEGERLIEFIYKLREPYMHDHGLLNVFNGMKEVISTLSKKHDVFVITSNLTHIIEGSIKHHRITGIKEVIGGDIEMSKVKKINSIKKKYKGYEIYYIGDTIGDVKEAKQAEVKSIAVTWGYHSRESLKKVGADYVVDKPEELLKILL